MIEEKNYYSLEKLELVESIISEMQLTLPKPTFEKTSSKEYMVIMSDGVALYTRVYFPKGIGPWPVIVIRDCYKETNFPYHAHMVAFSKLFSRYGYAVVLQDVRGTGESEGDWVPIIHERNDGIDTIDWICKQQWMDGNIGLYGHSYRGTAAFSFIDKLPDQVKTMFLSAFSINRHKGYYENGMFKHDIYTSWAVNNYGGKAEEDKVLLYKKALKTRPHIEMDKQLFGKELPWYRQQITNVGEYEKYWSQGPISKLTLLAEKAKIPLFLLGGWFDHHLDGMAEIYEQLPSETKQKSVFLIGPWGHNFKPVGDLNYPNCDEAGYFAIKETFDWFEYHLKNQPYNKRTGVLRSYVIGAGNWLSTTNGFAKTDDLRLYFRQSKQEYKGGTLSSCPGDKIERVQYCYNPENPVPSRGSECLYSWLELGSNFAPPGSVIQDKPGEREDVLTFISQPFEDDLQIFGRIFIKLFISTDVADTAFTVKIMETFPNGNSYNVRDTITSLAYRNGAKTPKHYEIGEKIEIILKTWPIAWNFHKGSKLRVDISSSNFPAYHVHPNIAGIWSEIKDTKIAKQTIYMGDSNASFIELPIIGEVNDLYGDK